MEATDWKDNFSCVYLSVLFNQKSVEFVETVWMIKYIFYFSCNCDWSFCDQAMLFLGNIFLISYEVRNVFLFVCFLEWIYHQAQSFCALSVLELKFTDDFKSKQNQQSFIHFGFRIGSWKYEKDDSSVENFSQYKSLQTHVSACVIVPVVWQNGKIIAEFQAWRWMFTKNLMLTQS